MKISDLYLPVLIIALFLPFILIENLYISYNNLYSNFPFIISFVKFAILATIGELIGLRIRTGEYGLEGFGILPRAIIWGILGMSIQAAFIIFAKGVPVLLESAGFPDAVSSMEENLGFRKLFVALSISIFLNIFYAPVLMTVHKITDSHITGNKGSLRGFFNKMEVLSIIENIDWKMHWGFVIKRTIPLFWIPAQTINFLMPEQFRVLIAALLGIVLGVILAFAARTKID